MTKRYLLAAFSFALVLCLVLICGIALLGKTVTAQAADETPDGETAKHWVRMRWGTISADGESSTGTSRAMAQLEVREGSTVTITARDDDAVFVKWIVEYGEITLGDENSATTTFTMPDTDVRLNCEEKQIRYVTVTNGTLESGKTSEKFTEGDTVKIIAADTLGGKPFNKWLVTYGKVTLADENSTTTTFVMPDGRVEITALYKSEHNLVLVEEIPATCTENGTKRHYACTVEGCGKKFTDETETKEITDESELVIPMAHRFGEWIEEVPATDEATGTKAHKTCEFCGKNFDKDGNEIEDLTLYKTYSVLLRWGTLQADGKTSTGTGSGYAHLDVRAGTVVTIIAPEKSDAEFVKWTVSGNVDIAFKDENSAMTTFVMPKQQVWLECEYKAIVAPTPKHNVTIENGTNSGGGEIEVGQTVTVTANKAPEGKEFDKWVVVSGEVTLVDANNATTTFVMPNGAVEIKATYKDKTTSGGSQNPDGGDVDLKENNGLSTGAIVGISVGGAVVVGVGGFAVVWFAVKKKSFADLLAAVKGMFAKK